MLLAATIGGLGVAFVLFAQLSNTLFFGMIRNFVELLLLLRDIKTHQKAVKKDPLWHIADFFESRVDYDANALLFVVAEDGSEVSRRDADELANQIAHWAKTIQLKQKDTAALMMFNKPEFFSIWLGLSKVGVSTGLLNTNLTGKSLLHSIELALKASSQKVFIVDSELTEGLAAEIAELEESGIRVYSWDDLYSTCRKLSTSRPSRTERNQISNTDPLVLIYTSGTTGLPKASKISSTRFFSGGSLLKIFCYLKPGHRLYCCLPLYHSAAGVLGMSGVIKSGATMVLR